jgi:hypothetical protein
MMKPIDNCYWVVPGKLLAGEYPIDRDPALAELKLKALLAAGVSAFIDLTGAGELKPYAGMIGAAVHQRFPIRDGEIPRSPAETAAALDAIDRHLDAGRLVYVYCLGGIGRTGVIIGCWLSRHGWNGQAALDRLRELWRECPKSARRRSPETLEQEHYVLEWE